MTSLIELCRTEEERGIVSKLAEHEILTDRDLLLTDDAVLKRCNLPKDALDGFCQDVLYSGIQPIRGDKLLESSMPPERMSTGFKELDQMLLGGLLRGSVTEFAGPSNTCKTVLLSNILISRLSSVPDVQAVYIDTLGTYNPSLFKSLIPRYSSEDTTILDRIHLMTALDMVTLIEACETIKQYLSELVPIELLVIDTIANPISLLMNKGQLQGHALMQSFAHLLRLMTTQYNVTTLLVNTAVKTDTNTLSAFLSTKIKPALGVTWTFFSDTCIFLHRSVEENTITVEVIRSRTGESGWTSLEPQSFTFR